VYVVHWDHDSEIEADPRSRSADLHGSIGHWSDDPEPEEDRRRIGFRLPHLCAELRPELVGGFPRGPSLSFDGKTWEPL